MHNKFLNGRRYESIQSIGFSGVVSDWGEWSEKGLALATDRGYADSFIENMFPSDDDASQGGTTAKQRTALQTAKHAISRGYLDLQLSRSGLASRLVKLARTPELGKGDLKLALTNLHEEYQPQQIRRSIDLMSDFQQARFRSAEHNVIDWKRLL